MGSGMIAIVSKMVPDDVKAWMRKKLHARLPDKFDDLIAQYRKAISEPFSENVQSNLARLRMNVHIIDKGLHRPDWEFGHSDKCYAEAKKLLVDSSAADRDPTFKWADKVLREYEEAEVNGERSKTPESDFRQQDFVHANDLERFFASRTTCRNFEGRPVLREDLMRIVDAGLQAPSSCCRQTLKVYGSVTPETARDTARCFHGFTGFSDSIPSTMVFCADIRPYGMPGELFYPTFDTALAADHAALMASALGMSMAMLCWIPQKEREERLRTLHNIPEYEAIVVGAVCGYPKQQARKPPRKRVAEALVLN